MRTRWASSFLLVSLALSLLGGIVFQPQYPVFAASNLTITPITWNVVGLDSNDVNVGPSNFPVGARVCNSGDTAATNVVARFVWDDGLNAYSGDPYINLRAGSLGQLTEVSMAGNNTCKDFYFEVTVTRDPGAYNQSRDFHIEVTSNEQPAGVSTPTPREIFVERLVSQNRNSVLDVQLNGVSIAAGGTMNLVVGNTYTIKLISSTATNGYEQIETFINFPNTIFQILQVASTYGANGGTDPNAATKLYADGCGWINDPNSPNYRKCSGVGKYGDTVTITYVVRIISSSGTAQPLNTLIYDFSGSSYHYNSDFADSVRFVTTTDPSSCPQQTIAQWTFNGTTNPSTGTGTFTSAGVTAPAYVTATGNTTNPAVAFSGWDNLGSAGEYLQFAVSTVGYNSIQFSFGGARAGGNAPTTATLLYSSNGSTFTAAAPTLSLPQGSWTNFAPFAFNSVPALDANPNVAFRLYASGGAGGSQANRAAWFDTVTVSGCALPANINFSKSGVIDPTVVAPANVANVGDVINYTLVITNTGGVPLTGVTLTDDQAASLTCTPALAGLTLQPGQSTTCTGSHTLTQADFNNGSVTNVAVADSNEAGPVSDSTTQTIPQTPALSLDKTVSTPLFTAEGQQITYTYTLTNTGNVTLTAPYSVTDDRTTVDCSGAVSPLAPGASTTCTATYTITNADVQAGSVTNIATASATFGNTTVPSNQDTVTVNYGGLNIIKEVSTDNTTWDDTSVKVNAGATVYYRIRVQNTGTVTLTGVTVDDGMAGCTLVRVTDAPGDNDANFEAGESWVYTCSVTAIAGTQNNVASADSNETDPDTDTASYFGEAPSLDVVKSIASAGPFVAGDTINYSIVVTNTGNITLTNVTITDNSAQVGTCTPSQPSTLAPGASMTCPATHTVTQADVDAGSYVNTATADSDQTPEDTDTETVTFVANPSLNVVKSVTSAGPFAVGDTINYSIVVTNTGNITLTNVEITDNSAQVGTCTPSQPSTLAPGGSMTCPATHTVTQADVNAGSYVNIATASSDQTPDDTDTETVTFTAAPALDVVKSVTSNGPFAVGDTINYSIVVTNTGNVTLTNVTIVDNSAVVGICSPVQPSILVPGASMTCPASHQVTQSDVNNGSYINTATADSDQTPEASDSETVTFAADPSLNVVKNVTSNGPFVVGDTIDYSIVVTNTGNVTLTNVTIADNSALVGTCSPAQPSTLAPGASMICPATHTVTQADVDNGSYVNTATADSDQTPEDTDSETVTFVAAPALNVVKSLTSGGPFVVGDTINYSIVVTNTGNITLTNVTISDNSAQVGACSPVQPSTLAPGASMTCPATHTVTQSDVDNGSYVNVATAGSDQTPDDTDTETVDFPANPALNVDKNETSNGPYVVGDTISYSIVVTNTGNVTLTGVTITDDSATLGSCTPAQPSTLAPGANMTCPATHTVTQSDVDNGSYRNTATAGSDQTPDDTDTVVVEFAYEPALNVEKSQTSSGPYKVGDTINYSIVVTNTGNITLTNVTVSDDTATLGSCTPVQPSSLAPGAAMTCSASHVVTSVNVDNGSYTNIATAGSDQTPDDTDSVTVDFAVADLSLLKTVSDTTPDVSDVITFTLTVLNIGPEPATNVAVRDQLPSGFTLVSASASQGNYDVVSHVWTIGNMAVNQTTTLSMQVLVNATGVYTNVAQISAALEIDPDSRVNNNDPDEDDQDEVTVSPNRGGGGGGGTRPPVTPQPVVSPLIPVTGFMIPVTGFKADVVTDTSSFAPETYAATGDVTLEIPGLNISIPIVGVPKKNGTWNVSWLGNEAGWLEGTSFPSWNGNSVLTSHVYMSSGLPGPFVNLNKLKFGDKIIVHAYGQKYIFEVQTNTLVKANDQSVMKHEEKPWLTLITCKDYDEKTQTYKNRVVVRAVLVKVEKE